MTIDGKDISDRYILWGAMNIRSAGPALHLAPKAKTDDGRLDFVAVREHERQVFIKHVNTHLAGRKQTLPVNAAQISRAQNHVALWRDAS